LTTTRLITDRRQGVDRRAVPRRKIIARERVERRRQVDRRFGSERRSTLERRGRSARYRGAESPSEHVRNAMQLLAELHFVGEPTFDAAVARLLTALELLEHRR
jgi:hypothetical protein